MPDIRRRLIGITAFGITTVALTLACLDHWFLVSAAFVLFGVFVGASRPAAAASLLIATYPMFDFTPWSGQWAMRHHDFLVLGVCAGWCGFRWHEVASERTTSRFSPVGYAYLAWVTVSAVIGFAWLSGYGDSGAIIHLSPGNAFRSAKGVWIAFAIVACYPKPASRRDSLLVAMARGAPFALIYFGCWCLAERLLFIGWGDWDRYFRIGGPMSGASNLGGQASEAFVLVMMVWSLLWWRSTKHRSVKVLVVAGIAMGAISLVLMQTRSALAVMMLAGLATLLGHSLNSTNGRRAPALILGGGALVVAAILVFSVPAIRTRLAGVVKDVGLRGHHYQLVLGMLARHPVAWCCGTGAGTFPTLFATSVPDDRVPGWFSAGRRREKVGSSLLESHCVVKGGESGYLGWFVGAAGRDATAVRLRLRSERPAKFGVHLCEKNLTQSVGCRNGVAECEGSGVWQWQDVPLSPHVLGEPQLALGTHAIRRPLFLSLGTSDFGNDVEIDAMELVDRTGQVTWRISEFEPQLPGAFMTTDDYWPFHAENDLLHLLVEQGLIGLGLWLVMFIGACRESLKQRLGDRAILLTLFFVIALFGLINSPIDTPEAFQLMAILILCRWGRSF